MLTAGIWLLDVLRRFVPAVIYLLGSFFCWWYLSWTVLLCLRLLMKKRLPGGMPSFVVGFRFVICCCGVLPFFFGRTVELFWPPQWLHGLPKRERSVLESDLMSEGLSRAMASTLLPVTVSLLFVSIKPLRVLVTLSGAGPMLSAEGFLYFAKAHKDLIGSFPDLKKLLKEAEEDPEMEESEWRKKVKEIWGISFPINHIVWLHNKLRSSGPEENRGTSRDRE